MIPTSFESLDCSEVGYLLILLYLAFSYFIWMIGVWLRYLRLGGRCISTGVVAGNFQGVGVELRGLQILEAAKSFSSSFQALSPSFLPHTFTGGTICHFS